MNDRLKLRAWDGKKMTEEFSIYSDGSVASRIGKFGTPPEKQPDLIILQSTGRRDKDKNLIFEEDILKIRINRIDRGEPYEYYASVFWSDCSLAWALNSSRHGEENISWVTDGFDGEFLEIVGNTYQNKDLL